MYKLSVELVPKTCWYVNVRSNVPTRVWDKIRKRVYEQAGYVCEICGGKGKKHPVECHEVWSYDDIKHIQKLEKMIALCPACHNVKHLGRAKMTGQYHVALYHLMKVNNMSYEDVLVYARTVFEQWLLRSQHTWKLNLVDLKNYLEDEEKPW